MDTSILTTLSRLAPDLMEEAELRALILERVGALGPIGRRALAARLRLTEREVRAAADALKEAGCLVQSAAGMELTPEGCELVEAARTVSRGRRTQQSMERTLARKLGVQRLSIVRGDADIDGDVAADAAHVAAQQLRLMLHGAHVLGVGGGELMAQVAENVALAAPMEITVVPAMGGTGGSARIQPGTVADVLAQRLGGQSRPLYLPNGAPREAVQALCVLPQVRETLELIGHADVLLYEVGSARDAAAQALGFCFGENGQVIGPGQTLALSADELGRRSCAAVAAGSGSAEAILALCRHHAHALLVTDEGAARRLTELLRT